MVERRLCLQEAGVWNEAWGNWPGRGQQAVNTPNSLKAQRLERLVCTVLVISSKGLVSKLAEH